MTSLQINSTSLDSTEIPNRPWFVATDIWQGLSLEEKKTMFEIDKTQPFFRILGISEEIWFKLSDDTRREMRSIFNLSFIEQEPTHGNFFRFFSGYADEIDDRAIMKSEVIAVNAMALVSALLLVILFGVIGVISSIFLDYLETTTRLCESAQNFDFLKSNIAKNIAGVLFSSLSGLIIATNYYIFRVLKGIKRSSYQKSKAKAVLLAMMLTTTSSVTCLTNLAVTLIDVFMIQEKNICDQNGALRIGGVGIVFVCLALVLPAFFVK